MHTPVQRIELTTWTMVRFFIILIGLFLLWRVLDILGLLFVVLIIVAALNPAVTWFVRQGIPRPASVTLLYLLLITALAVIFSLILPPLIIQLVTFTESFPAIIQRLTPLYSFLVESGAQQVLSSLTSQLSVFTQGVFSTTVQVFGGIVSVVTIFVLSFYLLLDVREARNTLITLLPANKVKPILAILSKTSDKIGHWLRGQITLSIIVGFVTFIGLVVLNVPYALALAVITGLLEIVPFIGAITAGILAILVAYAAGSIKLAAFVLIFYAIVQQIEGNFLVPKIMQSTTGLSPVVVIIALAVGANLAGIAGAIIAVPLAAGISVIFQEWPKLRE
ncbi:AI-2E family transporter [Candidatus Berkelbacteria bacterium]|nr:AI-2E family transporter [Candidatus Berkelbacteria bacterium]